LLDAKAKTRYGFCMNQPPTIAIIGAGPSALMAAEILATTGHRVDVYDSMPSPARKLLIAGRGGLNLTHSEPLESFITRYGAASDWLGPAIRAFPPQARAP
jgi:predicted flavoprotein YhiN